jgi:hypothetical protein
LQKKNCFQAITNCPALMPVSKQKKPYCTKSEPALKNDK